MGRALFVSTIVILAMVVAAQRDPDPDKVATVVSSYTSPPPRANDPISTVATSSGPVSQTGDSHLPLSTGVTIQPSQTPPSVSVQPSPPPRQQQMDMSEESDTTTVKMKPTVEPVIPETRMREVMSVIVSEQEILMTATSGALNQSSVEFGIHPSEEVVAETSRIGYTTTKSSLPPQFTAEPSTSVDESVIQPDSSTQSFPPTPEASIPYNTSYLLLQHTATAVLPNSMSQSPLSTTPTPSTLDPRLISPSPALRTVSSTELDLLLPTGVPLYTALSEESNTSVVDTLPEHSFISTPVPPPPLSSQPADYLLPQEMSTEILRDLPDTSTPPFITQSSAVHTPLPVGTSAVQEEVVFMQTSVQMLTPELIPTPREESPSPLIGTISVSRGHSIASTTDMEITSSLVETILPSVAPSLPYFMVEVTSTHDILTPTVSDVLFLISPSPATISSHQPPDLLLPTGVPLYTSIVEDSLTHHLTVTPMLQSLQTIFPQVTSFIAPSEPVGRVSSISSTRSSFEISSVSLTTDQQLLIVSSKPFPATRSSFTQFPFSFQTTSSFVSRTTTVEPIILLPLTSAPQLNRTVSVSASIVPSGTVLPMMKSSAQLLTAELSPTPSGVSPSLIVGTTSSSVVIAMGATSSMGGSMANESTYFPTRSTLLQTQNTKTTLSALPPSRTTSLPAVTDLEHTPSPLSALPPSRASSLLPAVTDLEHTPSPLSALPPSRATSLLPAVTDLEHTPSPSQVTPPLSGTSTTDSVVNQVGTLSSVESSMLSFTTYPLSSQSLSKTPVTATSQSVSSNPRPIQSLGLSLPTSRTETVTSTAAQQSGEGRITSSSTEHTASPTVQSTTTLPSSLTTSTATPPHLQATPTPSPCNPFTDYTPPPNSIVSIILAVPPLELIDIRQVGSVERCLLLEDLARVLLKGLTSKLESERESEANARRKLNKRQTVPEPQYAAVVVDITEDDSFGENLVDVRFFILDTSAPASPHSFNSTTVSEAYVLAAVDEISGFTIVRPAEPSEDLSVVDYFTPATDDSGPSDRVVVGLILGAAFLATLAVILGLLALRLLWRRRHLRTVKLQATTGTNRISLVNRTLIPTTSFEYESQPILQRERPVLSSHVTPASSHESLESTDSSSEATKDQSLTSLSQLARETHQQSLAPDAGPGSSEQVVTTLTHLAAAHSVSSESVDTGEREGTPEDAHERATTEMLERVTHYSSPPLPHHLPPLKPRFHHTTTTSDPPPTPPQSPSPTSTFRRLPTPPTATLTKPETDNDTTTPKRRKKQRRRRHHSTRPSSRGGDEAVEGLLVEEQETVPNDAEQELWLRRRATVEYHKYISGEESSFHPSFLSYKSQSLGVSGSPVGLPTIVQTSPLPPHMEYTVDTEQQPLPGSESESLISEEVKGSEETDSNSEISVTHHEQVGQEATPAAEHEKQTKERKVHKLWPPRHVFRRHKVAPVTYSPPSSVPAHAMGTDLAWMDTVNGPQLMSVTPVPYSQPHLPWHTRPPQYVLPPTHVSTPPVHYVPHSTHSFSQSPNHVPLRHSRTRQQRAIKQQRKESEYGSEGIDGPENEEKQDYTQLHNKEEESTAAPHHDATPKEPHEETDKIHKMLGEAFSTSEKQNATTAGQEYRVQVKTDRRNSFSETSPHETPRVTMSIPVHVQPMHGATFPRNVQLVWPAFPAPQPILQPPTRPFHQNYYHPVYHTTHQPDLRFYGDPTQPSSTSTPRYRKKRPEQH